MNFKPVTAPIVLEPLQPGETDQDPDLTQAEINELRLFFIFLNNAV